MKYSRVFRSPRILAAILTGFVLSGSAQQDAFAGPISDLLGHIDAKANVKNNLSANVKVNAPKQSGHAASVNGDNNVVNNSSTTNVPDKAKSEAELERERYCEDLSRKMEARTKFLQRRLVVFDYSAGKFSAEGSGDGPDLVLKSQQDLFHTHCKD